MAARLDLHAEFELEGMKVVPPGPCSKVVRRGGAVPSVRRSGRDPPQIARPPSITCRPALRCIAVICSAGMGREK